ncbi:27 kDa hemolymph protein-like [Toxorhynchites rutilus septentrionalis]|uniref:27 kDa hemolymph protein-like n=1 Tax=Toxorhynchites rutilus septentrionalis TaxID=329112 RepID=UPI00247AB990|nr:27 kDa hemolymph protein-like [Toxorhynchites rutilus septentrionalis]XP_055624445.1 27 kDa hemolymph protein-like [Toxorhynchites rutilus septentrionalis]
MTCKLLLLAFGVIVAPLLILADDTNTIDVDRIRQHLPINLQNLSIPDFDEIENALKEKCIKAGGNDDSYEHAKQGAKDLANCIKNLVDVDQFRQEVEQAKPTGDLDTVFNKYCRKRNTLLECVNTFSNSLDPCLDSDEERHKGYGVDVFKNLLNFVCHKDGDQIALFIAEKGPECFQEQKDDLIKCVNGTFSGYLKDVDTTGSTIPKLVIGPKQCEDFAKLQDCFVRELEQCEESTPANLVESLFRFVRKGSPCDPKVKNSRR